MSDVEISDLDDKELTRRLKEARLVSFEIGNAHAAIDLADRDADGDTAHVYTFASQVSESSARECIVRLFEWTRRDPGCDITINLTSPGGSVFHGLGLFDAIQELRRTGHHITVVSYGWAASMGGILLQAGDKRVMSAHTYMLIHEASSTGVGKTSDIEDEYKMMERLQERLLDILSDRATLTKAQIKRRWKRKDWWLDAEQALEFGFIDEIQG